MDKERADFGKIVDSVKSNLNANLMPLCIPIGEGEALKGVVDIVEMKAMSPKGEGKSVLMTDIPAELRDRAEELHSKLIECAAEGDDALIEKYLEGEELTEEEVAYGLRGQIKEAKLHPIMCGSTLKAIGVLNLINVVKNFASSPEVGKEYSGYNPNDSTEERVVKSLPDAPFSAIVWKTYIDQYAGRFNYLKVVSGVLVPDMDVMNTNQTAKERISKLFSMIGNNQVEVSKLNCGDIGVVVKLEKTLTKDTLCDAKNLVVLPLVDLPQPVFSYAIESKQKGDEDKIGQYFIRVTDENPTITYQFNSETRQTVLSGMGEMQLDIVLRTLKEKNKIEVTTKEPRIAYRETVNKKSEAQYKHKKQTGGHGQYGEVYIRIEPMERGKGFEFKDSIVGGVIPRQYVPGVEKGIKEGMEEGVLAKYPVVDVRVEVYDGSYHPVDSSELSFKLAARNAFKKAMESASPQLLEPIMEVDIYVDKEYMGDILNDITSRRGKVLGMGSKDESEVGGISVVKAMAPLAEMLRYTIDLRSMTSGKATFEMRFSHYDPISGRIADKVIEDRKKELEEGGSK
jgi:elongation factor G